MLGGAGDVEEEEDLAGGVEEEDLVGVAGEEDLVAGEEEEDLAVCNDERFLKTVINPQTGLFCTTPLMAHSIIFKNDSYKMCCSAMPTTNLFLVTLVV